VLPNTYRAFYGTFPALRPFQTEVITPLLQGRDLILQAATGSGRRWDVSGRENVWEVLPVARSGDRVSVPSVEKGV
jgi:hypothetical protein